MRMKQSTARLLMWFCCGTVVAANWIPGTPGVLVAVFAMSFQFFFLGLMLNHDKTITLED